jgi:lipopolysaccharide biosynthesis glycosyltransferase
MELFRPGLLSGSVLYIDLDTIICGDIRNLLCLKSAFAGVDDFYKPGTLNSSVMVFNPRPLKFLYEKMVEEWQLCISGKSPWRSDQEFIEASLKEKNLIWAKLQASVPGIVSYKVSVRPSGEYKNATLVCFHGKPKPHELAKNNPLLLHWR